jgi:ADP-ribose pyrophosphatase YjhB (NUDIX family)
MYNNPTPVAVALIRVKNRLQDTKAQGLLVGRRTIDPCKGLFALPGGYVDELESAEIAASRELQEETGIIVPAEYFRPVATRITPRNRILIFCFTETTLLLSDLHRFTPNRECDELNIANELDTLCFSTHTDILKQRSLWDPDST